MRIIWKLQAGQFLQSVRGERRGKMEAESSERTNSVPAEPSFLDTPQGRRLAYHRTQGALPGVVYIHGLNSDMNGEKVTSLDSYCRSRGRAFVRFELSGHGRSSGTLRESTRTAWLEDVSAVLESLTEGPQVKNGGVLPLVN